MQKILAAALAASFAASTAFAGGMDAPEVDGTVENDDDAFIVAPSFGALGGGAVAAGVVGALALGVALSADDDNSSSSTSTPADS